MNSTNEQYMYEQNVKRFQEWAPNGQVCECGATDKTFNVLPASHIDYEAATTVKTICRSCGKEGTRLK